MADVILHLRLAGKAFGARKVLGAIDLALGAREIVALVGPSGCGKTTLLRIAGGLERDFDGRLEWPGDGRPRIGTVFQEPRLLPWRSVRENLRLAQETPDPALADSLLDTLGLLSFADAFPGTLSLGMARRVAIARAFAVAPELVLLDEPFVSLDPDMAAQSRDLVLAAWRARPTAMLLVTHNRAEAESLADRILVLGGEPARITAEIAVTAPRS
jgi:sulfonate transport system ATP-binding protein